MYEDLEWDNVPTIVPRYALHVENYLELMSDKNSKLETVESLRGWAEKNQEETEESLKVARNVDWNEKEEIQKKSADTRKKLDSL